MKGLGTDDKTLVNILCTRSLEQRLAIADAFKAEFKKNLIDEVIDDTSGSYRNLLVALLTPTIEFYCKEIKSAFYDNSIDESIMLDILLNVSNEEMVDINKKFIEMYQNNLVNQLKGDFRYIFKSLLQADRDDFEDVDSAKAKKDAEHLRDASARTYCQEKSKFCEIFTKRNRKQIVEICNQFQALTHKTLEDKIDEEIDGDARNGLIAIVRGMKDQTQFAARRFNLCMEGIGELSTWEMNHGINQKSFFTVGTNDERLIRYMRMRCDDSMAGVEREFEKLYEKSLESSIKVFMDVIYNLLSGGKWFWLNFISLSLLKYFWLSLQIISILIFIFRSNFFYSQSDTSGNFKKCLLKLMKKEE